MDLYDEIASRYARRSSWDDTEPDVAHGEEPDDEEVFEDDEIPEDFPDLEA